MIEESFNRVRREFEEGSKGIRKEVVKNSNKDLKRIGEILEVDI